MAHAKSLETDTGSPQEWPSLTSSSQKLSQMNGEFMNVTFSFPSDRSADQIAMP